MPHFQPLRAVSSHSTSVSSRGNGIKLVAAPRSRSAPEGPIVHRSTRRRQRSRTSPPVPGAFQSTPPRHQASPLGGAHGLGAESYAIAHQRLYVLISSYYHGRVFGIYNRPEL